MAGREERGEPLRRDRGMAAQSLLLVSFEPGVPDLCVKACEPDQVSPQSSLPTAWRYTRICTW